MGLSYTNPQNIHTQTERTTKRKIPVKTIQKCYHQLWAGAQTNEVAKDEASTLWHVKIYSHSGRLSLFCVSCVCPKCAKGVQLSVQLLLSCPLLLCYTNTVHINNENTNMWMLYIPSKCVTDAEKTCVSLRCLHPRFIYCTRFAFIKMWTFYFCVTWILSVLGKAKAERAHGWSNHVRCGQRRRYRGEDVRSLLKSSHIPYEHWYLGFSKNRKEASMNKLYEYKVKVQGNNEES